MKKLILLSILFIVGCEEGTTSPTVIHGCTDSQATNYDLTATLDNNSCEYPEVDPNICVTQYTGNPHNSQDWYNWITYECYTDISEEVCSSYATGDKTLAYYGSSQTCIEYTNTACEPGYRYCYCDGEYCG